MTTPQRREPRNPEEAAAFKGLGQAITVIREQRGIDRKMLASQCEMTVKELETIERGDLDEWWGGIRLIAQALDMPLADLMFKGEEFASA